jgi:hypothetical protein
MKPEPGLPARSTTPQRRVAPPDSSSTQATVTTSRVGMAALVAARKNGTHTVPTKRETAQKGGFLVAGAGFEPATSGL